MKAAQNISSEIQKKVPVEVTPQLIYLRLPWNKNFAQQQIGKPWRITLTMT